MIDLKALVQPKIESIDKLAQTLLRAFNLVNFQNVTDILNFRKHQAGDFLYTKQTKWVVTTEQTPLTLNDGLYLKALGDVFVEDFNGGDLSQSEYVQLANKYCMAASSRNRLVFDANVIYEFSSNTSFDIYVESGGWYCSGTCKLHWKSAPKAGYAIKILGRFKYGHHYASLVNNSNYHPLEGFNIGSYNSMLAGIGLCIGHSESLRSMNGAVVTSKFTIARVSVFDFDDVVSFYPGVWACELRQVNTMGGSWQTPFYFNGIDFGESIKLTNCFIADNHRRVADNELGKVNFNTGEFIIYGSSFNNMRVVINGDAVVKMNCPHFENPQSTSKNKRFLEVIGSHAYCVLDKPQIVIRDTPIYSNLFYCKAGSSKNKHPYAGGLVFISPSYNAAPNYRPDLAAYQDDGIEYESDGYLELVGGGGRVYLEGGAHINSLYYTNSPIPIARNLVGRSTTNINFDNVLGKSAGSWVYVSSEQSIGSHFVEMNRYEGISIVNKANIDQELQQKRVCFQSTMLLGSIRYKIEDIKELNPQGVLETVITFSNINGKKLKDNFVKKLLITTEESIEGDFNFVEKIPIDAYSMNVILRNYGDTQYTVTWNKAILNIV
jgi:hypothetical protein